MTVLSVFLITVGGIVPAGAQQIDSVFVRGIVYDSLTNRPIPFAVVSVAGTSISALTNRGGRYRIAVPRGEWEFQFRKIGYEMVGFRSWVSDDDVDYDAYLNRLPFELAHIVVTADADNPARRIIAQAIARKNDLLDRIHDYRYDAYIKFLIQDLSKAEDSTDSVVLITETQTSAYWEKPDKYQEVIKARRQSSNLSAEDNLVSVGQIVNFNRNRVDLEKYAVVSPTADDALDHYDFHMLDTLDVDGRTVFRLAIEPGSNADPLFVGVIDIADSTFDVLAVDVRANEAVRFDYFNNLRYRQRLKDLGDDYWMPHEIIFSGELHVGVPIPFFPEHMSFSHTATLSNFSFDEGNPPSTLGEYLVVVDAAADDADTSSWNERRPAPLTGLESDAYTRIDSLEQAPRSVGSKLVMGTLGALFVASNADFFHFNHVEGPYLGMGWTFRDISPDLVLRGKAGYAFGRKDWQYNAGVSYRMSEPQRIWVGASYSNEIVHRPAIVSGTRNSTFLVLFDNKDPLDYFHERRFALSASTKLTNFTRLQLQFNDARQSSVATVEDFSFFERDRTPRLNPAIMDGHLRSISGSVSFDSRKRLKRKGRDFYFNTLTYTTITLGGEYSSPGLLDSDFDYFRTYLRVHRRQRTFNMGLTLIEAAVGMTVGGNLPPQRYFTVDFGNDIFLDQRGFNTLGVTNFSGNRVAMFFIDHDFDQQLFRKSRIPIIKELPFTLRVHGGAFWTDFVDHDYNLGDENVFTAPSAYAELGFGIGNLTPMLTPFNLATWFSWQLSSYPTRGFNFSVGVPLQQ